MSTLPWPSFMLFILSGPIQVFLLEDALLKSPVVQEKGCTLQHPTQTLFYDRNPLSICSQTRQEVPEKL